jgi:hypothetical protein
MRVDHSSLRSDDMREEGGAGKDIGEISFVQSTKAERHFKSFTFYVRSHCSSVNEEQLLSGKTACKAKLE